MNTGSLSCSSSLGTGLYLIGINTASNDFSTANVVINGVTQTLTSQGGYTPNTIAAAPLQFGASSLSLNGDFFEMILCNNQLSTTQFNQIYNYMRYFWAVY